MKLFSCGSVVPDCRATFEGESEDEILDQVATHAREAHGIAQPSAELIERVRANIQPSP